MNNCDSEARGALVMGLAASLTLILGYNSAAQPTMPAFGLVYRFPLLQHTSATSDTSSLR
ncbi:hypothetical protein ACO0LB_13615 [Undibacterium sp. SXout7W]|uniref:hypothetical protein n=1 Tax=Undibacterium sp. SXout7W TaxID=3413049 RepID=UPI003BF137F4